MKKYLLLFATLLSLAFVGCEKGGDETTSGAIELASPRPTATVNLASATFSWAAIAKCAGYAYAVDGGEETEVDATVLSATISALTSGEHSFAIRATGDDVKTTDSQTRTITFSVDPTLASPVATYVQGADNASVTVSWEAVASATAYKYKLGDDDSWTTTSELTKQLDNITPNTYYTFQIYAVGDGINCEDSEITELTIAIIDTSNGVFVKMQNGNVIALAESVSNSKIYESLPIACSAIDSFTILIDGEAYGFMPYSGNGGVGTVNTTYATVPYENDKASYAHNTYYIEKSVGRLSTTGDNEGQNLWVNLNEDGQFIAKVDLSNSDNIPRYRVELVKDESNILLEQNFDLLTYGGEWVQNSTGRKIANEEIGDNSYDGTEKAETTASYTTFGMIYLEADNDSEYFKNRDLDGWYANYCYEFPGYIRLSNTSSSNRYVGVLKTPALSKLTSTPTDAKLSFSAVRFASENDIKVCILGVGTLSEVKVDIEGKGSETPVEVATDSDGNSYFFITSSHTPKHSNSTAPKPWTNFTATISGATSETRVMWDCGFDESVTNGSVVRICIDNILITR